MDDYQDSIDHSKRKILFSNIMDIIEITGLFDVAENDYHTAGGDECFKIYAVKYNKEVKE